MAKGLNLKISINSTRFLVCFEAELINSLETFQRSAISLVTLPISKLLSFKECIPVCLSKVRNIVLSGGNLSSGYPKSISLMFSTNLVNKFLLAKEIEPLNLFLLINSL